VSAAAPLAAQNGCGWATPIVAAVETPERKGCAGHAGMCLDKSELRFNAAFFA
jgi:hypothetical protein